MRGYCFTLYSRIFGRLASPIEFLRQQHNCRHYSGHPRELFSHRGGLWILLFVIIIFSLESAHSQTCYTNCTMQDTSLDEQTSLYQLYLSTNGPKWTFFHNWDKIGSTPICNLTMVCCDVNCRVEGLSLGLRAGGGFAGQMPESIGQLTFLQRMQFTRTGFTGTIPNSIGNLRRLTTMNFQFNSLVGTIPSSICNLTSLTILNLARNSLTGTIPECIGSMSSLTNINLFFNLLTGTIPESISFLNLLTSFQLQSNNFNGTIPSELAKLSSLQGLYLSSNSFSGTIPSTLSQISSLFYIYLSGNKLTGSIPSQLGQLPLLSALDLSNNLLTGTIPPGLFAVGKRLSSLSLSSNLLTGTIPPEIGNISQAYSILIKNNLLSGQIPASIGNISFLNTLDLSFNRLSGTLPAELSKCRSLQSMYLSNNALSGAIPPELGLIQSISLIDLSYNRFQGTISGALFSQPGGFRGLQNLYINNNQLELIPPEIVNLASLQSLIASNNRLSGPITAEIGNLSSLNLLDLSSNSMTGPFPEFLLAKALKTLILSHNPFQSSIPTSWRSNGGPSLYLPVLSTFRCSNCSISGSVGEAMTSLSYIRSLSVLDLSRSFLQPQTLTMTGFNSNLNYIFPALSNLDLSYNAFYGSLPNIASAVSTLSVFRAAYNPLLTGPIHSSWGIVSSIDLRGTSVSVLPSFVNQSFVTSRRYQNVLCPTWSATDGLTLLLDINFANFTNCFCVDGFEGKRPQCQPCKAGYYRAFAVDDTSPCKPCKLGTFAATTGLSSCAAAPPGQFVPKEAGTNSIPCPPNSFCADGFLQPMNSYWTNRTDIYSCFRGRCVINSELAREYGLQGSSWCSDNRPGSLINFALKSNNISHPQLEAYYNNTVCAECLPGFVEVSGKCIKCDEPQYLVIAGLWSASLIYVLFLRTIVQNSARASIKIFSFFVCTARELVPSSFASEVVSALDIRLAGRPICVVPAHSIQIEGWVLAGILMTWLNIPFLMILEYIFRQLSMCWRGVSAESVKRGHFSDLYVLYLRTFLSVITISISSLTDTSISLMNWYAVVDQQLLVDYPQVDISSTMYTPWFALALSIWSAMALYLIVMFMILRYVSVQSGTSENTNSLLTQTVRMWYDCYKPQYYYAEVLTILRRVVFLVTARLLIVYHPMLRLQVLNSFLVLLVVAAVKYEPYVHADDNLFETLLLLTSLTLATSAYSSTVNPSASDASANSDIATICVAVGVAMFFINLFRQFRILDRLQSCCLRTGSAAIVASRKQLEPQDALVSSDLSSSSASTIPKFTFQPSQSFSLPVISYLNSHSAHVNPAKTEKSTTPSDSSNTLSVREEPESSFPEAPAHDSIELSTLSNSSSPDDV